MTTAPDIKQAVDAVASSVPPPAEQPWTNRRKRVSYAIWACIASLLLWSLGLVFDRLFTSNPMDWPYCTAGAIPMLGLCYCLDLYVRGARAEHVAFLEQMRQFASTVAEGAAKIMGKGN